MSEPLPADVLARRERLPVKPAPVVLTGTQIELHPLDVGLLDLHAARLFAVSSGEPCVLGDRRIDGYDPDASIWRWMKGGPHADVTALRAYLAPHLATPDMRMMVVIERAYRSPIGIAAFMANHPADLKIELGHIWYGAIAQGTGAAREATMLMLAHAFGLGYRRVEWKCDALNERSRRSALSYGFTFEGIQQAHMISKGRNRDTAWFRMLDHEWPDVRARERSPG